MLDTANFQYIKRYQMVYDLGRRPVEHPALPVGFVWAPWSPILLNVHAEVKYRSFCNERDADLFPSFSTLDNCKRLMDTIVSRTGFLPAATWLIGLTPQPNSRRREYCATIQGLQHAPDTGGIQNVAVLPGFRRRGLGEAIVRKALFGFQQSGIRKVVLHVTAENHTAVQLYLRIGFQTIQTVYKETMVQEDLE
ncbi:MAG: GNAT family N-acetyltransferase [Planctomycetaceae bacterium]|nr:GNAT family N-acetyltransferase [Planctomycetaceae bacterium]